MVFCVELVMGVGPMNLVITNDALYQLSYTSAARAIILAGRRKCKLFFEKTENIFKKKESILFLPAVFK